MWLTENFRLTVLNFSPIAAEAVAVAVAAARPDPAQPFHPADAAAHRD